MQAPPSPPKKLYMLKTSLGKSRELMSFPHAVPEVKPTDSGKCHSTTPAKRVTEPTSNTYSMVAFSTAGSPQLLLRCRK